MARRLAESYLGAATERYAEISARARYCELLAARCRLPPREAHRVVLAAWVSGMEAKQDVVSRFVAQHGLEPVLHPAEPASDDIRTEQRILELVRIYQNLAYDDSRIGKDIELTQQCLERYWVSSQPQRHLLRRFIQILRDEAFLDGFERSAGRILIVDPEEAVAPVLVPPLSEDGFQVVVAADGADADKVLEELQPDVILCELDIPCVDGLDFFKRIRSDPRTADIPFYMMTSRKTKAVAHKCLRAGVDEVFPRPVDLELLFLKIRNLLKRPEDRRAEAEAAKGVAGTLRDMSFTDMIQVVTAGGKSVRITLTQDDLEGEVVVQKGEIVCASLGAKKGQEAFYALMRWREGNFAIHACIEFPPRTINASVTSLLLEGARRADTGDE
ncbi:MAG: response regulator [Kiritimatiellae bacterium]|nr:response regulator [Kiritimatiellia bacterium]